MAHAESHALSIQKLASGVYGFELYNDNRASEDMMFMGTDINGIFGHREAFPPTDGLMEAMRKSLGGQWDVLRDYHPKTDKIMNEKTRKALINKLPEYTWNGLWLVEWNENQQQFHIESAQTRFCDSIGAFNEKRKLGAWNSLGIFNSREEAQAFVDLLRDQRGL